MSRVAYIDFDGTLSDCTQRIYKLFAELAADKNLSYEQYWNLRRQGNRQVLMLTKLYGYDKEKTAEFKKNWLEQIEQTRWLNEDEPIKGAAELLQYLAENSWNRVLLTNRQSEQHLMQQLQAYGWQAEFEKVLVTKQRCSKLQLLKNFEKESDLIPKEMIYIGDSIEDIRTAQEQRIPVIAVRSNLERWDEILQYQPDYSVQTLGEMVQILNQWEE